MTFDSLEMMQADEEQAEATDVQHTEGQKEGAASSRPPVSDLDEQDEESKKSKGEKYS